MFALLISSSLLHSPNQIQSNIVNSQRTNDTNWDGKLRHYVHARVNGVSLFAWFQQLSSIRNSTGNGASIGL